jgi:LEA14-like dessication related protein
MKKVWIPVAVFTVLGLLGVATYGVISISKSVNFEVLSYAVQSLDNVGVTFRVSFLITNPSGINLEVWNQYYEFYVGGYKISTITSNAHYTILADNSSVIPLDVRFTWNDIQQKVAPMYSQTSTTAIGDLPVLIKGKLSAKTSFLRISYVPVRFNGRLSWFLP